MNTRGMDSGRSASCIDAFVAAANDLPNRVARSGGEVRLRGYVASARQPSPESRAEGLLATRSSLTNTGERRLVAQICPRWNPLTSWMRQIEDFQRAA